MSPRAKQVLAGTGSVLVIAASASWLLSYSSLPDGGLAFHERVGRILAEQTAQLLGNRGRVSVITLDPAQFPVFRAQLLGFRQALRSSRQLRLAHILILQPQGDAAYGLGRGLDNRDFLRALDQQPKPDAIVSLVGVPNLRSEQIRKLGPTRPFFIAEAKFGEHLRKLLDRQFVQVAVVPRFLPAAAGVRHLRKVPANHFDLYFQVLRAPPPAAVATDQPERTK
ncbi:MAG: hypothetical protein KGS61_16415 [Verrucomicrobia bacterium]|nr:hypothetical protein [Verrucomicrobiota bacterium]